MNRGISIVFTLFSLIWVLSASIVPVERAPALEKRAGRILIGYNGFNGVPRPPQASGGGELGSVFYVADAVDLAKFFAHGADPTKDFVCLIHADATQWGLVPKAWVPQRILSQGGSAVNNFSPGTVVFAPHTNAGLPAGSPASVYQLGVRQAQISRLDLTADCKPKADFASQHQTLNYPSLDTAWNIQRPTLRFYSVEEQWQNILMGMWTWVVGSEDGETE